MPDPLTPLDRVLGYGLLVPFRRDGKSDFANGGGLDEVRACVDQILGTFCGDLTGKIPGELPWEDDFGCRLELLRHRNNDQALQELARVWVTEALGKWEPRVRVSAVEVTQEDQPPLRGNVLRIRLHYAVVARGGGQVLAPDVSQDVLLQLAA